MKIVSGKKEDGIDVLELEAEKMRCTLVKFFLAAPEPIRLTYTAVRYSIFMATKDRSLQTLNS